MVIATLLVGVPLAVFFDVVMIYFVAIAITGIRRAVSITLCFLSLEQKELGVGTSLVNFVNSLSD